MRPLQFRVLGPLEVADESPLELGGPKPRALLAQLIANCGEVVSAEALIDALWGETPPVSAANSLQSYVSRLRKIVGTDRIESRGSGYVLQAESGEVDALEFEKLVTVGRGLVEEQPEQAAATLRDALGMWRGRPYADITDGWRLSTEATRLDELRLTAVEDRIEADLACGKHAMVVGELEALVEEHPWRERAWGQLMTALYRAGRQAEALRAFQRARRILGEEVGIEPSSELRAIEEMILQQSPELGAPVAAQPATPAAGMSVRGYELRTLVGRAPHGDVYRGYHAAVGREVDIQVIGADLANDADFIRSFEATARALGSLDHPHIVPVHDFWREPDAAYFVTGFRVGRSLAELAATPELTDPQAVRVLEQVAAALDAAHSRGLVHGNLDASTVVVDGTGTAMVHGFDPARPDALDRSTAEDFAALTQLAKDVIPSTPAPPLTSVNRAADIVAAYRASLDVAAEAAPTVDVERNPYKGLRAFEESDAGDFFGRASLVAQLVARLDESGPRSRFLAVVGPSGSGKSSVVKAGLLDALRRGALPGSEAWFTVTMFPGAHPFAELEAALLRIAVNPPTSLLEQLEDGPLGILRGINRVLPDATSDFLLVVDQFEELFTLTSEGERERFLAGLLAALEDPRCRMRIVVTLRADFHDRPLAHHGLAEWMRDRTEVVIPLTRYELEEAIAVPAGRVGVEVERELVSAMVTDVTGQAGGLPLLQYALTGLFDGRRGNTLTLADYEASGGISGAVASRAEATYADLDAQEQKLVRQVFLRLVTVSAAGDATRRRVRSSELFGLGDDRRAVTTVVDTFGAYRLLTFGHDPVSRGPTVEVAHEALLTRWPRLAGWIEAATDDVRSFNRLSVAAHEWVDADRSEDYLVTGGRLEAFAGWAERTDFELSRLERQFLTASIARRDAALLEEEGRVRREAELERRSLRRLRTLVAVLLGAGVIGSMLTVFAFVQRSQAQEEARLARGRTLVAGAVASLEDDPELAILLSLEAVAIDASLSRDASAVLHRALPAHRTVLTLPGSISAAPPDGSWILTGDSVGTVRSFDGRSGEALHTYGVHDAEITTLAVSDDGSLLASGDTAGTVRIWDRVSNEQVGGWEAPTLGEVKRLRFHPNGTQLVTATERGAVTVRDFSGAPVVTLGAGADVDLTADGTLAVTPTSVREVASGAQHLVGTPFDQLTSVAAINAAGRYAVGGFGPQATWWGIESGDIRESVFEANISALDIDDTAGSIAAGLENGTVAVWSLTKWPQEHLLLSGHDGQVSAVQLLADGERVLSSSLDGVTRIWDISPEGGRHLLTLLPAPGPGFPAADPYPWDVNAVGISGDGARLATLAGSGEVTVFEIASAEPMFRVAAVPPERREGIALNFDGSIVLSTTSIESSFLGSNPRPLSVWAVPSGEEVVYSDSPNSLARATSVSFSTDGESVAYAGSGLSGVFTVGGSSAERGDTGIVSQGGVASVKHSPDGSMLLVGDDGGLLLVDLESPSITAFESLLLTEENAGLLRISHPAGLRPNAVTFSSDGGRIAATWREGGVSVFSVEGELLMHRADPPGAFDLAFVEEDSLLAVLNTDGRLQLLDASTGTLEVTISDHTLPVRELSASAAGKRLATASIDGTARVYTMDEDELFEIARTRLTRDFSPAECQEYQIEGCD